MRLSSMLLCAGVLAGCAPPTAIVADYSLQWEYRKQLQSNLRVLRSATEQSQKRQADVDAAQEALDAANAEAPKDANKVKAAQDALAAAKKALDAAKQKESDALARVDDIRMIPPAPYPDEVEQIHSSLKPPGDLDHGYANVMARCEAAEREKNRALRLYQGFKWPTLLIGAGFATTATIMAGINDENNLAISPNVHNGLRIANIVTGAIGVLFTTAYGFVNFDSRIDTTRSNLRTLRQAMDRARTQWGTASATDADKLKLLDAMATACNAQDVTEAINTQLQTTSTAPQNPALVLIDAGNKLSGLSTSTNSFADRLTQPQTLDTVAALTSVNSSLKNVALDPHLSAAAKTCSDDINATIASLNQGKLTTNDLKQKLTDHTNCLKTVQVQP